MIRFILINVICWIIYLIILLCSLSFLIPLGIWKSLIVLYVRLFKSNFGQVFTDCDSMFAVDNFYKKTYATNVKIIVIEGNLNIDEIRHGFKANVLSAVNEKNNESRFEKLYQIPFCIGGYYFWKKTNIDIFKHIREDESCKIFSNSDPIHHENELNIMMGELMALPFIKHSPLWEIILYRGYKINQSLLVFRFHHSLGDGYSFNHIIDRLIQKTSSYTVKNKKKGCYEKTKLVLTGAMNTGILAVSTYVHNDYYTQRKCHTSGVVSMTTISLENMKKIRRVTKSHFATVGMSLLAGALRRCFIERNLPVEQLPSYISIMHSLPKPNHPINKMVNHWGVGFFKIPMQPVNALNRLYESEKNFTSYISEQYDELIRGHIMPMMALVPSPLLRLIFKLNFGTAVGFTSIPAYDKEAFLFGQHKILDIFKIFGLQWSQSAVAGAIYTHNGKVSFTLYANKDIIPDQATIDRVTKEYLHDELNELLQQCGIKNSQDSNHTVSSHQTCLIIDE